MLTAAIGSRAERLAEHQPLVSNWGVTGRKAAAPAVHFSFRPCPAAAVAICSRPNRDFVVTPIDGRHRDDPCSARRVSLFDQATAEDRASQTPPWCCSNS